MTIVCCVACGRSVPGRAAIAQPLDDMSVSAASSIAHSCHRGCMAAGDGPLDDVEFASTSSAMYGVSQVILAVVAKPFENMHVALFARDLGATASKEAPDAIGLDPLQKVEAANARGKAARAAGTWLAAHAEEQSRISSWLPKMAGFHRSVVPFGHSVSSSQATIS